MIPQYRVLPETGGISGFTKYRAQKKFFGLFWWDLYPPVYSAERAFSIIIADKDYQNSRKK